MLGPRDIPGLSEASLNLPVLIFAAALTLAVALVCSLVPLVGSGKVNLTILLKESSTGSGTNRTGHALRGGLMIAEIAVAVILYFTWEFCCELVGRRDPESRIRPRQLLALELQSPPYRTKARCPFSILWAPRSSASREARRNGWRRELSSGRRRLRGLVVFRCRKAHAKSTGCARHDGDMADTAYFRTMRIPLIAGRARPMRIGRPDRRSR